MITIEAIVTVTPDGKAAIQLPPNIPPGRHKVVLAIDEQLIKEQPVVENELAWDEFEQLIERCAVDTGIEDLAHQHDHYIHGTPKREAHS
ncbi:hypothetical protein C7Y66_30085 [Chroococcidiopsis sp. CCALA 051]|uniref:hypothetical protein n=1 Tax=unclassified Chroococcidiopsis TaxID=2646205 RepID=UPI000D0CC367|nr:MULTISPECIES: hypothetical protein [unclassified Chroococcidiopsis]MBE9018458.1 hypothetical protein [Chroococcidiopsidales cyanobacterium LEGE 13417]PSM45489.1 hypothetical protein C7Y66_30085 [Chroococcidiopsis sp. CCALA 051]URD50388.1 hypothetical protein M5J74_29350 [Chroococcidiopsis sp. CCNUC1]